MTKITFNYILDQIKGIEILMGMMGCNKKLINKLLEDLADKKYNDHSQYLTELASGLITIAEGAEKYEICETLLKLINKLNGRNNNPGISN